MTTAALQQLLAELDAAPAGCLDDVWRRMKTLARGMMQMQQAVEDNARLAQRDALVARNSGFVLEQTLAQRDLAIGQRDDALRLFAIVQTERDAARAEVERLTKERDEAREGHAAVFNEMMGRPTIEEHRAEVARLKLMVNDAQKRAREDVERETVEAIVKYLNGRTQRLEGEPAETAGIAALISSGAWRSK